MVQFRKRLEDRRLDFKNVQTSLELYRCLQLLLKECNSVYAVLLGNTSILNTLFAIFCTYGAIRFHGLVGISFAWIGTNCTAFLAMMLGIMADFNGKSKQLLIMFKLGAVKCKRDATAGDSALLQRQLRALREMRFQMGALYFVDKQNVMTVFKVIFDFTINLLILH